MFFLENRREKVHKKTEKPFSPAEFDYKQIFQFGIQNFWIPNWREVYLKINSSFHAYKAAVFLSEIFVDDFIYTLRLSRFIFVYVDIGVIYALKRFLALNLLLPMPFKLTMTSALIWCKFYISKFNVFSKAMTEHPFKAGLAWIDRKVHTDGEREIK